MDWLRSSFGLRASVRTTDCDNSSPSVHRQLRLIDLPPEIILCISDQLRASDEACFALVCHRFKTVLARLTWQRLNSADSQDRRKFLSALARDLPQYYDCYGCVRLHPCSSVNSPRSISTSFLPCLYHRPTKEYLSPLYLSQFKIHFAHVHLVMKWHRQIAKNGPCPDKYGLPLDEAC